MIVVLRYKTIDKSPAEYCKSYVQSVVYHKIIHVQIEKGFNVIYFISVLTLTFFTRVDMVMH